MQTTDTIYTVIKHWQVFGLGMAICLLATARNIFVMFILPRRFAKNQYTPSPLPGVGGLMGAMGCLFAPSLQVKAMFWLPLLVDPGTGYCMWLAVKSYRAAMAEMNGRATATAALRAASGCLLGTAIGDAMGLAAEGLSRRRQQAIFPGLDRYHFLFGKGFCSDDTEHACMTANALISARHDQENFVAAFRHSLAWRLRFWLLALPAGVGLATGRGIIRLWLGCSPDSSGVFSAGNGPAMRTPILGAVYGTDRMLLQDLVHASTRLTHTDPRAEHAAYAVALAAHYAASGITVVPDKFLEELEQTYGSAAAETLAVVSAVFASVMRGEETSEFAASINCNDGVSGYALHTVPVCLHAWLSHPLDFRSAVLSVIHCGGDADTTAAIVGGIVGAAVGRDGIPQQWRTDLQEWPRTVAWIERLGVATAESALPTDSSECYQATHPPLFLPGILLRNVLFLIVVVLHGFRRMLPPY